MRYTRIKQHWRDGTTHLKMSPRYWRVHVFGIDGSVEAISETQFIIRRAAAKPEVREFQPVQSVQLELEAFADAVEGRAPFSIPMQHMIDTIAAFEAICRSVDAGHSVDAGG